MICLSRAVSSLLPHSLPPPWYLFAFHVHSSVCLPALAYYFTSLWRSPPWGAVRMWWDHMGKAKGFPITELKLLSHNLQQHLFPTPLVVATYLFTIQLDNVAVNHSLSSRIMTPWTTSFVQNSALLFKFNGDSWEWEGNQMWRLWRVYLSPPLTLFGHHCSSSLFVASTCSCNKSFMIPKIIACLCVVICIRKLFHINYLIPSLNKSLVKDNYPYFTKEVFKIQSG